MSAKIGIRAWIDFAFRKIFGKPGNEICLISLLNAILDLPQPIESVEFMNPFSYKDFEDDKLICVDVKATDRAGRVFIVEVQIVVHPSFAKRAVYYACKGYSDQLQAGQGYSKLKATVGVVPSQSSVLEQWCYWIKYSSEHTAEELRELLPGLAFLRATKELGDIQTITEEKAMYDSREKAILDYESNLIDAREEGREEGRDEGREEGEAIGMEKGRIQLLQELLDGPSISQQELNIMSLEELQSTTKSLQSKLRERNA